ncbi:PLP-dependent aminotransferase family protein [Pseudomonas sp. NPDC090592]|uniref:MocR-like ectoine utilization transcription factor EhuR n=1 Tax=Pseudomonas sp. NPDC090592 TaxID=3364480 RepID=UPI00383AF740
MLEEWRAALQHAEEGESKYKTLVRTIADDIEQGRLAELQRLPSQRQVAHALGISGQTVTNAYQELERLGLLRCEVGRGSHVSKRVTKHITTYILDEDQPAIADLSTATLMRTTEHERYWRALCERMSQEQEQPWLRASRPIAGAQSHREIASAWIGSHGLKVEPGRVMITNGATHALHIALTSITGHGDLVACENLTDHGIIGSAQVVGFSLKGLDTDAYGIKPEDFDDLCCNDRVTALVCTPNLNNPTSSIMPDARRREIAEIAGNHGVFIIEDDVYGPLLGAGSYVPISQYLPDLSFYCTSLTKSVMTSLRVGFLVPPKRAAARAETVLRLTSWMTNPIMSEVAARWLRDGTAEALTRVQRQLIEARQALVSAYLKEYILAHHPRALIAWLRVPPYWGMQALVSRLRELGIAVTSSEPFTVPGGKPPQAIRISIGAEYDDVQMKRTLELISGTFASVA